MVDGMFHRHGRDVLNALGFAYIQTGNPGKASEVLGFRTKRMTKFEGSTQPRYLEVLSLNQLLKGDEDAAYRMFATAVDNGWAAYFRAINDPRWGETLQQPRFQKLLERAQENIAVQRAMVLARDSGDI